MFLPKRIGGFAWRLLLYYLLLGVAPWPGFREAYADLFRAGANAVFFSFAQSGRTKFEPASDASGMWDTRVIYTIVGTPMGTQSSYNAWIAGWIPLATLVALVLATPVPWSRRWRALVWGLVWTHVFILLRVYVLVLFGFSGPPGLPLLSVGPFGHKVLETALEVISVSPVTSSLVPVFIWLLVTFRYEDWAGATRHPRPSPDAVSAAR